MQVLSVKGFWRTMSLSVFKISVKATASFRSLSISAKEQKTRGWGLFDTWILLNYVRESSEVSRALFYLQAVIVYPGAQLLVIFSLPPWSSAKCSFASASPSLRNSKGDNSSNLLAGGQNYNKQTFEKR